MRHHPVRRLAAALLNVLFLLAWGEPVALHPCPMHDGVAVTAVAGTAASTMAADMAAHHGQHAMMPAGHDGHHHVAGHVCSCLGQCCVVVGVVAPTAQAIRWQVLVRRRAEPIAPEAARALAAAPRLLPFANGPPRAACAAVRAP